MATQLDTLVQIVGQDKKEEVVRICSEQNFAEAVSYAYDNVISVDPEKLSAAEHAVGAHDKESDYYKLFIDEFNMKEHFSQVCSHRKFVKKAFFRVQKFLDHMTEEDAERHDLTKFTLAQGVGYTARWVHGMDNACWKKALQHHYDHEPHHPQYFPDGKMEARYLEESLVDMIGSRWERNLNGAEEVTNQDLVDFNPVYLSRYCPEDLEKVKALIEKIKQGWYVNLI